MRASPDGTSAELSPAARSTVLVVACGALARELDATLRLSRLEHVEVTCLPATLHSRPERIPAAVATRIRARRAAGQPVFVAYADCGTGGALDRLLAEPEFAGIERLPGAHCYELYAGAAAFAALAEEELGTFYLTDFLAKAFDRLVWTSLGLDRHPELRDLYFGSYRRVVHLAQTDDPAIRRKAEAAAHRLGLAFESRPTGLGPFGGALAAGLA